MATGDSTDMLARLSSLLPARWFGQTAPNRDAVLGAISDQLAWVYDLFAWVKDQTRISTATGVFLDLISLDFLGLGLRRKTGEQDTFYRARIMREILRERVTRNGVSAAIFDLTGRTPAIFEPMRPADTGGYGLGGCGYGMAGGYGSVSMPTEYFIKAGRPITTGIPSVGGYHTSALAYRTASASEWASLSTAGAQVADAEIYATVERNKPIGTTAWVQINS